MSIEATRKIRSALRDNTRQEWYKINAKADSAEVLIYGEIGDSWWGDSVPAAQFVKDLAEIKASQIDFHIHSPGGDVFDGLAIATAIRTHEAKTTAYVDGLAASAASVIAIAADETVMALGAQMMIHDAWGIVIGNSADMAKMADDLGKISDNLATLYAAKAGGKADEWRSAMEAETWYSADEAVTAGLANRVDKGKPAVENHYDMSIFAHKGRADAPSPHIPQASGRAGENIHNPEGADMPSDTFILGLKERLGIKAEAELDEAGLLAAVDEALAESEDDTPPEPKIPEGYALVDKALLDTMRADASEGRAAREQQLADRREGLVQAALSEGRIAPARADAWRAQLQADPGAEQVLASLEPVVSLAPVGFTGGIDESSDDDRLYAKLFGNEGEAA